MCKVWVPQARLFIDLSRGLHFSLRVSTMVLGRSVETVGNEGRVKGFCTRVSRLFFPPVPVF
jgi:hypothetical protein